MLLGPVDQPPSNDDPDAGLIEAATRIFFIVVATGVAALVVIAVLGFVLLAVVDGVVRLWRRWRAVPMPPRPPDQPSSSSSSSSST